MTGAKKKLIFENDFQRKTCFSQLNDSLKEIKYKNDYNFRQFTHYDSQC